MKTTVKIDYVRLKINEMLRSDIDQEQKHGLCTFLESLLHETGNYKGFSYNFWLRTGFDLWVRAGQPEGAEKNEFITNNGEEEYYRYYFG